MNVAVVCVKPLYSKLLNSDVIISTILIVTVLLLLMVVVTGQLLMAATVQQLVVGVGSEMCWRHLR